MTSVGFQVTKLLPEPREWAKAVRDELRVTALAEVSWPTVNAPVPDLETELPDQYDTSAVGIVSAVVLPPVVKLVAETVAVQFAGLVNRLSFTCTVPSWVLSVPPGATVPRLAEAGTLITSVPAT